MHFVGYAAAFPAQQQDVVGAESKVRQAVLGLGGEQHQPTLSGRQEGLPGDVAGHLGQIKIIHAGPLQFFVVQQEAAGFDDIHRNAQASP